MQLRREAKLRSTCCYAEVRRSPQVHAFVWSVLLRKRLTFVRHPVKISFLHSAETLKAPVGAGGAEMDQGF
jgi:hypothetical protein